MSLTPYALNNRCNYLQLQINGLAPPVGGYATLAGNQTFICNCK